MNEDDNINFPIVALGQIGDGMIQTTDGRQLHAYLENGDKFAGWIADRIRQYGFTENVDFVTYSANSEKGRPSKEYALSLDMAKELAMVERNEKGKQARRYFIECERKAKAQPPALDMRDISQLRIATIQLIEMNQEKDEKIAALTPKAEAMDRISASEGSVTFTQAAKIIGVKQDAMTRWMHSNGWIYRQNGSWVAYAQHIQNGRLEYKEHSYNDATTGMRVTKPYCHITPKGLARLAIELGGEGRKAA